MKEQKAIGRAKQLAAKSGRIFYVVRVPEHLDGREYQVASEFDMETFYMSSQRSIVFCTAD